MWTYCSDINAIFYRILTTFSDIYQNLLSELRAALRAALLLYIRAKSGASRRPTFLLFIQRNCLKIQLRAVLRAALTLTLYPEKLPQDRH